MISFSKLNNNIYHIAPFKFKDDILKFGLCSPLKLYESFYNNFMETSYNIYKSRTQTFMNKKDVNSEDVLYFLDNSRKPLSSKSIFFSNFSIQQYHKDFLNKFNPIIEITLNINELLSYNPILIQYKTKPTYISWDQIDYSLITKKIKVKPPQTLMYKYIPHIALNCYHIPPKFFKNIEVFKN